MFWIWTAVAGVVVAGAAAFVVVRRRREEREAQQRLPDQTKPRTMRPPS